MCIVIDTNVLSCVFSLDSCYHKEYQSVYMWIINGEGFIVCGGTTYWNEIKKARKYLGVLAELKKKGKLKDIKQEVVDNQQTMVKGILPSDCDDSHLIAIFRASGCRLLCSNDHRVDIYIKNKKYYLKKQRLPKIYRNKKHAHLLCKKNIVTLQNVS